MVVGEILATSRRKVAALAGEIPTSPKQCPVSVILSLTPLTETKSVTAFTANGEFSIYHQHEHCDSCSLPESFMQENRFNSWARTQ